MSTIQIIVIGAVLWAALVVFVLCLMRSAARDDAMLARTRPPHPQGRGTDG